LEFNSFIGSSYLQDLSVCDELIEYFETHENLSHDGFVGVGDKFEHNSIFKKSREISFKLVNENLKQKYFNQLSEVLDSYKAHYTHSNTSVDVWGIVESPKIQRYKPSEGFFSWHCETGGVNDVSFSRHLVFMTYLNDVNDGGETEFLYQQVKVRPRKGLTLIWPSPWTHMHRGITSMTETKYIVTGWYSFIK
jgi:prolyl 4-hydroxylase